MNENKPLPPISVATTAITALTSASLVHKLGTDDSACRVKGCHLNQDRRFLNAFGDVASTIHESLPGVALVRLPPRHRQKRNRRRRVKLRTDDIHSGGYGHS